MVILVLNIMEVYLGELDTDGCVLVQYFLVVVNNEEKELIGEE
jgi:hypothetical protein